MKRKIHLNPNLHILDSSRSISVVYWSLTTTLELFLFQERHFGKWNIWLGQCRDPWFHGSMLLKYMCQGRSTPYVGDGNNLTFNRNRYNGYINPYYWVDDHPLLYGNNGSCLFPSTYEWVVISSPILHSSKNHGSSGKWDVSPTFWFTFM